MNKNKDSENNLNNIEANSQVEMADLDGAGNTEKSKSERGVKSTKKSAGKKKFSDLRLIRYFSDTISELKKVAWPTVKQIKNGVIVVLVMLAIVGATVSVLDLGFSFGMKGILSLKNFSNSSNSTSSGK